MPVDPRWQGSVEAELQGAKEHISDLEQAQRDSEKDLVALRVQIASLKTQIGVFSAVGGIIGAGVMSLAVLLIGGHH